MAWRMNRNNLFLSFAAHIRAVQRRRIVSEATAAGIVHFRMEVPRDMLGKVAPDGVMGRYLWRVLTLEQWRTIETRENSGRVASSAWDSLGLGFGDVSYLVPVPEIYYKEAVEEGRALRRRWLSQQEVTT